MSLIVRAAIALIGVLVVLATIGRLGLQVRLKPFSAYPEQTPALETVELPADLPAPVARCYKTIMGDQIPVIESAVISGRGSWSSYNSSVSSITRTRITWINGLLIRSFEQSVS